MIVISSLIFSCLGIGKIITSEEFLIEIPYDQAFDLALESAKEMQEKCKIINVFNFPVIVSLGTSKSREVITVHYKYDPEAGSVCIKPPESLESMGKRVFVPHFGAEFYMYIRFLKEGNMAKGVKIEVTQYKGVKKEIFEKEMYHLRDIYLTYLKKRWKARN